MVKIDRADKVRDLPEREAAPERVAAFQTGLSAKGRAAALLILARDLRTPHGEIDLVAKRRSLLAFVEMKARATRDDAAFAVTPRQTTQVWLVEQGEYAGFELRFDAILIAPRRLPRHLLAAFDAST
jgi:putative endonuclease